MIVKEYYDQSFIWEEFAQRELEKITLAYNILSGCRYLKWLLTYYLISRAKVVPRNRCYIQRNKYYQPLENLPIFKDNHNRPFLVFKGVSPARLTYPYGIGNISDKSYSWTFLHISQPRPTPNFLQNWLFQTAEMSISWPHQPNHVCTLYSTWITLDLKLYRHSRAWDDLTRPVLYLSPKRIIFF